MSTPIRTRTDVFSVHSDWLMIGATRPATLRWVGDPYAYPGGALVVLSLIPADSITGERVWQVWDLSDDGLRNLIKTCHDRASAKHVAKVNQSVSIADHDLWSDS